jgi:hypothetical protein
MDLAGRLEEIGRSIGAREREHAKALDEARQRAWQLHSRLAHALSQFQAAAEKAGAPHLRVELGEPRLDDKHVRAIQVELRRGRHQAIVTVKSRGEVTLVGPFRRGKAEGPCRTFPFESEREIDSALGDFVERFLEEAMAP